MTELGLRLPSPHLQGRVGHYAKTDSIWEQSRASKLSSSEEELMLGRQMQLMLTTQKPPGVLGLLNYVACILRTRNALDVFCANQHSLNVAALICRSIDFHYHTLPLIPVSYYYPTPFCNRSKIAFLDC